MHLQLNGPKTSIMNKDPSISNNRKETRDSTAKEVQKKKKRSRKSSKETTETPKTTIKTFFKEECIKAPGASTPTSAKK